MSTFVVMIQAALYLFPVGLSDTKPLSVLPASNIELLREVRHFVVENVRSARRFLKAACPEIQIDSLTFTELNEHTPAGADLSRMLTPIRQGEAVGVLSEAGCPAIADPGANLVAEAQHQGIRIIPLVGPSSILLSLMASGFNGQSFAFLGYLPINETPRAKALKEMARRINTEHQTQIFIETPYRNNKLIQELTQRLPGQMLLCVASDITGPNESILTMSLSRWAKATYNYNKIPTIFLLFHS